MKVQKLLEYKLKGERNISSRKPIIIGEKLFVVFIFDKKGSVASKVIGLDKHSFEVSWTYDYPFVINNIQQSIRNNPLICTMDGKLIELEPDDGSEIHTIDLEMNRCGQSSNIVDNQIAIGGVQGTKSTHCVDLHTRSMNWSFNNGGHSYVPLIANAKVYQSTEKHLRCLDLKSGRLIWQATEESSFMFNPVLFNDTIVVGCHGFVNIYSSDKGKLLHQIKIGTRASIWVIAPENNVLYFGDESGRFYAYAFHQKKNFFGRPKVIVDKLWSFESNGCIRSTPLILDGSVLFTNDDNKLICLDKKTGVVNWTFNTKGEAGISGIAIEGENIYLSVGKGYVYKLKE